MSILAYSHSIERKTMNLYEQHRPTTLTAVKGQAKAVKTISRLMPNIQGKALLCDAYNPEKEVEDDMLWGDTPDVVEKIVNLFQRNICTKSDGN